MEINKELKRIAEYQNSILPRHQKRTAEAIDFIVNDAIESLKNGTFNFKSFLHLDLNQNGKHRQVIMYKPFSPEELLCIFLKRVLDRKFHISYPNRNEYIRTLFDTAAAIKDMSDYTIFKFDFSDFFNTVSSEYVYHNYIQGASLERYQDKLMADFVHATKYTFAGLNTSNILCEIIARDFDQRLVQQFSKHGIILYKRYIDDGIMMLNRYVDRDDCLAIVNDVIKEVFLSPKDSKLAQCKTALNLSKVRYIAGRYLKVSGPSETFDFLGYEFELTKALKKQQQKTEFRYGITQAKIDKYTQKIEDIVKEYVASPQKDIELLRHRIKAFTHRSVYQISRYKSIIWKNKGFIANYCELRFRMNSLTNATEDFLKNAVIKAFANQGVPIPYFLKGNRDESIYSLYNNMQNYRTLLFVELIGINHGTLKKMCRQIGIDVSGDKGYDGLVRDYLVKVKVGH